MAKLPHAIHIGEAGAVSFAIPSDLGGPVVLHLKRLEA